MRSVSRGVVLVIAVLLHLAVLYAPQVPASPAGGVPGMDKVGHVAVFALVAAVALWIGFPARLVIPVLLAHAVLSELIQHVALARRSGDPWDVLADVVGAGLGWLVWRWWQRFTARGAEPRPSGPGR